MQSSYSPSLLLGSHHHDDDNRRPAPKSSTAQQQRGAATTATSRGPSPAPTSQAAVAYAVSWIEALLGRQKPPHPSAPISASTHQGRRATSTSSQHAPTRQDAAVERIHQDAISTHRTTQVEPAAVPTPCRYAESLCVATVPKITLQRYVSMIYDELELTPWMLAVACSLVERVATATAPHRHTEGEPCPHNVSAVPLTILNVHRLFFVACVITEKCHDDEYHSQQFYGGIVSMPTWFLRELEMVFMSLLHWDPRPDVVETRRAYVQMRGGALYSPPPPMQGSVSVAVSTPNLRLMTEPPGSLPAGAELSASYRPSDAHSPLRPGSHVASPPAEGQQATSSSPNAPARGGPPVVPQSSSSAAHHARTHMVRLDDEVTGPEQPPRRENPPDVRITAGALVTNQQRGLLVASRQSTGSVVTETGDTDTASHHSSTPGSVALSRSYGHLLAVGGDAPQRPAVPSPSLVVTNDDALDDALPAVAAQLQSSGEAGGGGADGTRLSRVTSLRRAIAVAPRTAVDTSPLPSPLPPPATTAGHYHHLSAALITATNSSAAASPLMGYDRPWPATTALGTAATATTNSTAPAMTAQSTTQLPSSSRWPGAAVSSSLRRSHSDGNPLVQQHHGGGSLPLGASPLPPTVAMNNAHSAVNLRSGSSVPLPHVATSTRRGTSSRLVDVAVASSGGTGRSPARTAAAIGDAPSSLLTTTQPAHHHHHPRGSSLLVTITSDTTTSMIATQRDSMAEDCVGMDPLTRTATDDGEPTPADDDATMMTMVPRRSAATAMAPTAVGSAQPRLSPRRLQQLQEQLQHRAAGGLQLDLSRSRTRR